MGREASKSCRPHALSGTCQEGAVASEGRRRGRESRTV